MSRRKTDTKTLLHNNNTPRLWKRVKWISGERIKLLKKINANAPAKTLHFISSPRSMCHTIKPGPYTKILSIVNFTSKLLNCFVLKTLCSKATQLRCLLVKLVIDNIFVDGPGFKELYSPWLFWLLVNYYYVYIFFLVSKHWYTKMLVTHLGLLLCTLLNAKISRENALFGDFSTFNNLLHFY